MLKKFTLILALIFSAQFTNIFAEDTVTAAQLQDVCRRINTYMTDSSKLPSSVYIDEGQTIKASAADVFLMMCEYLKDPSGVTPAAVPFRKYIEGPSNPSGNTAGSINISDIRAKALSNITFSTNNVMLTNYSTINGVQYHIATLYGVFVKTIEQYRLTGTWPESVEATATSVPNSWMCLYGDEGVLGEFVTNARMKRICAGIISKVDTDNDTIPDLIYLNTEKTVAASAADFYYMLSFYLKSLKEKSAPPATIPVIRNIEGPVNTEISFPAAGVSADNQKIIGSENAAYIEANNKLPDFNTIGTDKVSPQVSFSLFVRSINYYYVNGQWATSGSIKKVNPPATWTQGDPLPVELTSFSAAVSGSKVILNWNTVTETNNQGFEIEKRANSQNWKKIGFINGSGTSTHPKKYSFTDQTAGDGIHTYRLKQIDYDGTFEYSQEVQVSASSNKAYSLAQNYPNPFNPATTIQFQIPQAGFVTLKIYNVLGSEIATLINKVMEAGSHSINFDASGLSSGVYLYQLKIKDYTSIKRMLLTK